MKNPLHYQLSEYDCGPTFYMLGVRAFELLLRSKGNKNCFDSGFIS